MTTPIRHARKRASLTLIDVFEGTGVDTGNLSRIERGTQTPSAKTAEVLAGFFKARGIRITEEQILYPRRFMSSVTRKRILPG